MSQSIGFTATFPWMVVPLAPMGVVGNRLSDHCDPSTAKGQLQIKSTSDVMSEQALYIALRVMLSVFLPGLFNSRKDKGHKQARQAWRDVPWLGRRGGARFGAVWYGRSWQAVRGMVGCGTARQARRDQVRFGSARQGRQGEVG